MTDLRAIERAGRVRRFHANPDLCDTFDPVGYHAGRVARICMALWPDCSAELLKAALTHDDGEGGAWGDVPGPAKALMPGIARQAMEEAEYQALYRLWGRDFTLTHPERKRLHFADKLDAFMWCQRHAPDALDRDEWARARAWLRDNAIALGVADKVAGVVG